MSELLHNRIVQGAITGFISAAWIDFVAFRSWKTYRDATAYDWQTAIFRWGQGVVTGAITALGIQGVS